MTGRLKHTGGGAQRTGVSTANEVPRVLIVHGDSCIRPDGSVILRPLIPRSFLLAPPTLQLRGGLLHVARGQHVVDVLLHEVGQAGLGGRSAVSQGQAGTTR